MQRARGRCRYRIIRQNKDFSSVRNACLLYTSEKREQQSPFSFLQTVKETIGVGVNEKAALSSDKNCPFVYINFDFTLVNKVADVYKRQQKICMSTGEIYYTAQ